jgi:PTS system ascorbate-specific IIA component
MPLPPLRDAAVVLAAEVADWRAAVALTGEALAKAGVARPAYADEMIRMIETHGPYVVIAPGLALAHARPGVEVLEDGLAVVTLATPVDFGNVHNDPVRVILGLAVSTIAHQLPFVAALANVFNDSDAVDRLAAATSVAEVREILGATEEGEAP